MIAAFAEDDAWAAFARRDRTWDGRLIGAVKTTGIYCRPSCPAITPRVVNMRFFPSAAAAQGAGFRACKRCRPDATPGSPEWRARSDVAANAAQIGDSIWGVFGFVVLAWTGAFSEELFFRGHFFTTLRNLLGSSSAALVAAVVATVALFAAGHGAHHANVFRLVEERGKPIAQQPVVVDNQNFCFCFLR